VRVVRYSAVTLLPGTRPESAAHVASRRAPLERCVCDSPPSSSTGAQMLREFFSSCRTPSAPRPLSFPLRHRLHRARPLTFGPGNGVPQRRVLPSLRRFAPDLSPASSTGLRSARLSAAPAGTPSARRPVPCLPRSFAAAPESSATLSASSQRWRLEDRHPWSSPLG
jgi:hypothetical protein